MISIFQASSPPQQDFSRDLTIIIAHRGPAMGLWMTIESCEADLCDTGINYSYVVVSNGTEKLDLEEQGIRRHLGNSGRLVSWIHHPEALSPPGARQLGSYDADGRILAFLDNHCVVAKNYFSLALDAIEQYDMDMLHSTTKFFCGEKTHYEYNLTLEKNFWAQANLGEPKSLTEPYRIAAAGHGGFFVKRSVWEELGGYGPVSLMQGYAGEELLWDLKAALHDKTNWIHPQVIHHHWSGTRPYSRHFSEGYYRNLMICAYVIGGLEWLEKIYKKFSRCSISGSTSMYHLYEQAMQRGQGSMLALQKTRHRTLDEQLTLFAVLDIPY